MCKLQELAMEDDIFFILPMVTHVLTVHIANQERGARMVAYIMITVACAFIGLLNKSILKYQ
jgi:hypothetical protein